MRDLGFAFTFKNELPDGRAKEISRSSVEAKCDGARSSSFIARDDNVCFTAGGAFRIVIFISVD